MQHWKDDEGIDFKNSDICFGKEFKPHNSDKIDIVKISVKGRFPATGWGYLEECHEMAVITKGSGKLITKDGEVANLREGDVVYIEPERRFCWDGDMDMIVPCGPAFSPDKHKLEEDENEV